MWCCAMRFFIIKEGIENSELKANEDKANLSMTDGTLGNGHTDKSSVGIQMNSRHR